MFKPPILVIILTVTIHLLFTTILFAQTPNFGSAANFAMFTSSGAVSNTGVSVINGDIGTNLGTIDNFSNPGTFNGRSYNANNVTAQATADLLTAYNQLMAIPTTNSSHAPSFGNETIYPGVYEITGAGSVNGTLTLDAKDDNTKIFIFKIGAAFTTGASTIIILKNGAMACNVFWVAEGAIAIAASTYMAGTLIAHGAANSMGAGASLQGRLYSTLGALSVNNVKVSVPTGCTVNASSCSDNPAITNQPVSSKICIGQPHTFNVTATGTNLTYQWRKEGTNINGATGSSYTIDISSSTSAGFYDVVVVGSCSPFIASSEVILYVASDGISMGSTVNFVLFTCSGAVSNAGASVITGDLGTNAGTITGFESANVYGSKHSSDVATSNCSTDMQNLYNQLRTNIPTNTTHANAFGNGETLPPGVYSVAGAGSVNGSLTLDAAGNSGAIFIFKIGGAFTTAASSSVTLINGASSCNIFWVAEGAIAIGTSSVMKGTVLAHNAAASIAASSILDGRLFSTLGAIAVDNSNLSKPTGCLQGTKWTGTVNKDWFTTCNWYYGLLPTDATDVTIPKGLANYPTILNNELNTDTAHVANFTIESGASVTLNSGILSISGILNNAGSFDASAGSVKFKTTTQQTITANTFVNNNLQNLIIANNITLAAPLNITGAITFTASNTTFNTGDFLTLKSTAKGTASLGDLTKETTLTGNTVTGNITAELFIPAKRAWRLLSGLAFKPGQSINAAWQEGATSGNPAPGFGTQITGGTTTSGFDQGINKNAGIKIYNSGINTFTTLPLDPGTNIPVTNYPGYFLFIRGDRSTNLSLGVNAPLTPTTLRIKGPVNTGDYVQTINAAHYTLVGNPYLESVDFHKLEKNNVADKFYVWDPKISGVGGYVSFIWDGSKYVATSSISPESQYIPYGAAFFVEPIDTTKTGTLTFKEFYKSSLGSDAVFRPYIKYPTIRVDLEIINADKSAALVDGSLTCFDKNYNNTVDIDDAKKIYNSGENFSIARDNINLAIERRKNIEEHDTSFFKVYNLKKSGYKLLIKTAAMDDPGLTIVLKDNYLAANNNMLIKSNGITEIFFTVNTDLGSYAVNRFSIVYKKPAPLPIGFISVTTTQLKRNILVKWITVNELNTTAYELEKSTDGINFVMVSTFKPIAETKGEGSYKWLDANVLDGKYYYRIKVINPNGNYSYSNTINIDIDNSNKTKNIGIAGNIVKGNTINLQLNNIEKGIYNLDVFNMSAQLIKHLTIDYSGGSSIKYINIGSGLASGKYTILLSNKTTNFSTMLVK